MNREMTSEINTSYEYMCMRYNFALVLYGCEIWSLTEREEHKLRVFENRVLRRIFGPKRDEVTGGWRKLYNEELHNLYSSPSIIRIFKVEEDEVGRTRSTNGREKERV
jgi:hypothetical protein